jgi:hypothetical protein
MNVDAEASPDEDVSLLRQRSAAGQQHPESSSDDGLHLLEDQGLRDRGVVAALEPLVAVPNKEVNKL